jgi:hypothetical protein
VGEFGHQVDPGHLAQLSLLWLQGASRQVKQLSVLQQSRVTGQIVWK